MHKATVAAVGLLLLSVAALPVPAAGAGTGDATVAPGGATEQRFAAVGGAAVASAVAGSSAAPTRRDRILAIPGVDSIGLPLLAAVGGLLGVLIGAGALLYRRGDPSSADRPDAVAGVGRTGGNGVPATYPPARGPDEEDGPPPVRTDEEYVVQLLIANHGRMRQARIVEETEWSKAKVSRLLSRMEEREQVVRERAGREKIVQLADANTSVPL